MQSSLGNEFKTGLRIGNAVDTAFEPWESFLFVEGVFCPAEKVLERFVYSVRNILFDLGMKFSVFPREMFIVIIAFQCFSRSFVSFDRKFKKFIVDCFTGFKGIEKKFSLFSRRIQSILIHPEFHCIYLYFIGYLSIVVQLLPIHPLAKAGGFLGG